MTMAAGQVSLHRFQVLGSSVIAPEMIVSRAIEKKVSPIGWDELREEAFGWCEPFSGDVAFLRRDHLFTDQACVLGVRLDQKKVPGTLLRLQLRSALEALKDANGFEGKKKRIPKNQREAVQLRIREELMQRTLPQIKIAELVWLLDSQELWLCGASESFVERFVRLFMDTFECSLVVLNPGTMGIDFDRLAASSGQMNLEPLLHLCPVDFVGEGQLVSDGVSFSQERSEFL